MTAVTPGQAAYELPALDIHPDDLAEGWLAATYEPDESTAGVSYKHEDMLAIHRAGWDHARTLTAEALAAQERPAPAPDGGNAYEPVVCECGHPQTDHAFSAEVCAWLRCKCDSYRPQPAPDAARAAETRQLAAAMADTAHVRDAAAHVLSWFREHRNPVRMEASVTRAQLANAYRDGGLPVPEELRRFL